MSLKLSAEQVWETVEKELFAVVGMVTAKNEARTVGVVYIVRERKLYIATGSETWKARHIAANPQVSVTIPIAKRVAVMPWMKIPQATITFQGTARVLNHADVPPEVLNAILRGSVDDPALIAGMCLIEITPVGEFITYGVGIPLMDMREPEKARGRAPVG
jgi:hypothetical protein